MKKIAEEIFREGPVTFARFMELALYHPEEGYYSRSGRIGRAGDYYTSPHVHPAFGTALAIEAEGLYRALGEPARFSVIELGAGEGYLALDFLSGLKEKLLSRLTYFIVEPRSIPRSVQQRRLKNFPQVVWLGSLREAAGLEGLVLTNEVFDALPVHLVEKRGAELKEIYVQFDETKGFQESLGPLSRDEIWDLVSGYFASWPEGYRTEVNLSARILLREIASLLSKGLVLTIDYGYPATLYYAPQRIRGTLICYRSHRVSADPYSLVGEQDITAHVNFSALVSWGKELGLEALGFVPQGTYLVSVGLEEILSRLPSQGPEEMNRLKLLIFPQGLGETHQVLIQKKGSFDYLPLGLRIRNRLKRLIDSP
ncbi:class I SAM-dependent methyltransferase [Thermosulfuriphilus sp.]